MVGHQKEKKTANGWFMPNKMKRGDDKTHKTSLLFFIKLKWLSHIFVPLKNIRQTHKNVFLYRWVYKEWLKTFNISSQQHGTRVLFIIATRTKGKRFFFRLNWTNFYFFLRSLSRSELNHRQENRKKKRVEAREKLTLNVIILDSRAWIGRFFLLHLRSLALLRNDAFA